MRIIPTGLPDVLVIEPDVFRDARGFFLETYHVEKYQQLGIRDAFVQDNHSRSTLGTVRGLHLQLAPMQGKLVRVVQGEIFDVAVDVRVGSPTFGRWVGARLSAENFHQIFVPAGFAHGFSVLTPTAEVQYKCTSVYTPSSEIGIAWNDPALAIAWGVEDPILSGRDQKHPTLAELHDRLPPYSPPGV
jgi:dTDP-4-dehydrorhamnose 3,5-epimerase